MKVIENEPSRVFQANAERWSLREFVWSFYVLGRICSEKDKQICFFNILLVKAFFLPACTAPL